MTKVIACSNRAMLWILVACLLCGSLCKLSAGQGSDLVNDEVLEEFIVVPGMRMTEYNFWHTNETRVRCAEICLNETRVYCKSFSFNQGAQSCGIYANGRSDAPDGVYGPQVIPLAGNGDEANSIYFERKSKDYRLLEEKMKALENLTQIGVDFASEIFSNFTHSLTIDDEIESSGDATISSGELDLMSKILRKIILLNPVKNATPQVAEKFAQTLINVSDALMRPDHISGWMALQQNPHDSGVADIVTTTEIAGRDLSSRLLRFSNSTPISVESGSVGMWLDLVQYPEIRRPPLLGFNNLAAAVMERIARILNEHQEKSFYTFPPEEKPMRRPRRRKKKTEFQDSTAAGDDVIKLPTEALRNRSVVTHVRYKFLQSIIPSQYVNDRHPSEDTAYSIISSVLTTSVHPKPPKVVFEENPVTIIFKHDDENTIDDVTMPTQSSLETTTSEYSNVSRFPPNIQATQMCVFWRESDENSSGGWSEDGCVMESSNATHTVCKCQHLTSFAVLLQMVDTSTTDPLMRIHTRALSYVSYIGCTLSLVGVTIMCAAFIMLKFHTENMKIHFNLGVAVGAADCIFIFEEFAQKERYSCVLVTILLYYTNMAVLSWMLIEGLFLYSQVVVVFVSARRWVRYYVLAGWGIPAIVMGLAMGILNVQLGKNRICWLSPADNSIWAFAAPAILVIVINFIILISVVRVILGIQPLQGSDMKIARVKNAVKGSIFLSPLLGTTWLFGLLSLSEETVVFQYLFAVLNSLQGFFLFLFHCVCNSEVRADIARRRNRKLPGGGVFGGKSTTWFSGTFGLNVASGLRKFRNSISFDFANFSHSASDNSADKESKYTLKGQVKERKASSPVQPSPAPCRENSSRKEAVDGIKMEPRTISKILEEHLTHQNSRKLPPLPLMPMKNDVIISGRNNKVSPEVFPKVIQKNIKRRKPNSKNESFDGCLTKAHTQSPSEFRRKDACFDKSRITREKSKAIHRTTDYSNSETVTTLSDNEFVPDTQRRVVESSLSDTGTDILRDTRDKEQKLLRHTTIYDQNAYPENEIELSGHYGREFVARNARVIEVKLDTDIGMSYDSGLNSIDNDSVLDGDFANDEMSYRGCVFTADGGHVVESPAWSDVKTTE